MGSDFTGGGLPVVAFQEYDHGKRVHPLLTSRICQQRGQLLDDASDPGPPEL